MLPDPRACFLRACALDVLVAKPGNVSLASPGHGMQATHFLASAQASVEPLFRPGARVGQRIEAAMAATWAAAGCNTNLGILLLCAPIALAIEHAPGPHTPASLRAAIEAVLAGLDVRDAAAAYRGIALANPGGLGEAAEQDVREAPSLPLREAMALAAGRDMIARQYRDGHADLFAIGLHALPLGFDLQAAHGAETLAADAATREAVLRLFVTLLAHLPDSHIVRKHGEAVAQNVMRSAQALLARSPHAERPLAADPALTAWDAELKAARINPGTTADFTVATLLLAGLCARLDPRGAGGV